MKKTLFLAYLALLICFLLPFVPLPGPEAEAIPPPPEGSTAGTEAAPEAKTSPEPEEGPAAEAEARPLTASAPVETIRLLTADGTVLELEMPDYITGVLAAEMPASFEPEALKAQAVAAASYALYCAAGNKHAGVGADVCADFSCCQAWQDEQARRDKWGGDFEQYERKLRAAAEATAGQVLRYQGQPAFTAFHASSAGATEASGEIWNPVPYLVSVDSPETAGDVPNYVSTLDCAALDFRDVLLSARPEADFSGDESGWIGEIVRDGSGRVKTARLGGADFSGTELRSLFSLRSTAFELSYSEGRFLFTVTGSGHGVGMSQYGAQVLAKNGAGYAEILAHYYPGTELS